MSQALPLPTPTPGGSPHAMLAVRTRRLGSVENNFVVLCQLHTGPSEGPFQLRVSSTLSLPYPVSFSLSLINPKGISQ